VVVVLAILQRLRNGTIWTSFWQKRRRNKEIRSDILVFLGFSLNIANLLCDGLEGLFVIRVLCLQLWSFWISKEKRRPMIDTYPAASWQRLVVTFEECAVHKRVMVIETHNTGIGLIERPSGKPRH
jgi:hypothetical protein